MIKVIIDGSQLLADLGQVRTMPELVELVKATIDPDSIITTIMLNGKSLSDADWRTPLSVLSSSVLEISTGSKEQYLYERLTAAERYLDQIIGEFAEAADHYLSGRTDEANQMLAKAVEDLQAFLNWYATLLVIEDRQTDGSKEELDSLVRGLRQTCENLLESQLYQSWQVLGQVLNEDLNPKLHRLKGFCQEIGSSLKS